MASDEIISEFDQEVAIRETIYPRSLIQLRFYLNLIALSIFLCLVAYCIYLVRSWLPVIGYLIIGACGLSVLCGLVWVVTETLKHITHAKVIHIGANGAYLRDVLGRVVALPPLISSQTKPSSNQKPTRIEPSIPTFFELIDTGEIAAGSREMILGYGKDGQCHRDQWPRTLAIGGKGRSGKTRRVVFMVGQALISGAHITVCDPHGRGKKDSLYRELEELAPWIEFACSMEQIMDASRDFLSEMEKRVRGESEQRLNDYDYKPRLIVYDEWSRLMTRTEKEEKDLLSEVVTATSQEYAGVNGFACIIGQSWTNDDCGGTAIRRALHAVFVHRMNTEYARFLIKQRKFYSQTEQLATGHCYYQDLDGGIHYLIMPTVPDRACGRIKEVMMRISPQPLELLPVTASGDASAHKKQENELETVIFLPEARVEAEREVPEREVPGRVDDETYKSVLREIGKRLRGGETPNDIRKKLGVTGGRAMQEVNAALNFLSEQEQEQGEEQEDAQ